MQVNTKMHESHINKVKRGMKAKIRVDAFSNELLDGTVMDVAALPDTATFFSSDIKVYTAKVRIDSPLPGLRPGMNAEVTIKVNKLDKVLTVPVLAVLEFGGKDLLDQEGRQPIRAEARSSSVCRTRNSSRSRSGVKEGDIVAMSPISLMTDEEKRDAFGSTGKPTLATGRRKRSLTRRPQQRRPGRRRRRPGEGEPAKGKAAGKGSARARAASRRPAAVDGQALAARSGMQLFTGIRRREERDPEDEGRDV